MDEIGNMGHPMQVKLLRALQEREITPVGSTIPVPINTRLISATNSDIKDDMNSGKFRRDLYYRLNVFEINIPALKERPTDIVPLANHFLQRMMGPFGTLSLSDSAANALITYQWPGNVRELENVMERAVVLAGNNEIGREHLPDWIAGTSPETPKSSQGSGIINLKAIVDSVESHYIQKALVSCNYVKADAALMLGLKRTTLLARMKKLNIN